MTTPELNSAQLRDFIIKVLDDNKGEQITHLDVQKLTAITDYLIIVSGRSSRHVKALANHVVEVAKHELHWPHIRTQGEEYGEWVLVDLNNVVVHIMQPHIRDFYQLENLWQEIK